MKRRGLGHAQGARVTGLVPCCGQDGFFWTWYSLYRIFQNCSSMVSMGDLTQVLASLKKYRILQYLGEW